MLSVSRLLCARSLVLSLGAALTALLASPAAVAQATSGQSALDRQLSRIDLAASGIGSFTGDVTGTNYLGQTVTDKTSTTFGPLVTFRYTKSPWIGGEGNIGFARYTHNFSRSAVTGFPATILSVQANTLEYTVGYVAHPQHPIFGFQPFFGGGGGLLYFRPTSGGGEGLPTQGAGAFYYSVGVEKLVTPHFGVRAQARQLFYLSPDFYQNYLRTDKHTSTFEPGFGFYVHF
jgi:hypothetical protein